MVIKGEAGMQLMGDWAKGEFLAAGKVPGKDFVCVAAPGTAKAFTFNVDSFAMFKLKNAENMKAQQDLAAADHVARVPGGVQPQQGLDPGAAGHEDGQVRRLRQDSRRRTSSTPPRAATWCRRIAHGMAVPPAVEGAIKDVVSQFWNTDKMSAKDAMGKHGQRRRRRSSTPSPARARACAPGPAMPTCPCARRVHRERQHAEPSRLSAARLDDGLAAQAGGGAQLHRSAFVFIYGFIALDGYLSLSASRLLPNYEFVGLEQYARAVRQRRAGAWR